MAVGDAHAFPGFLTPVLTQLFFPKLPTTFLACFCRGERRNKPERKVASSGDRTYNHQVMSPTRSPLSHPGGAIDPSDLQSPFNLIWTENFSYQSISYLKGPHYLMINFFFTGSINRATPCMTFKLTQ